MPDETEVPESELTPEIPTKKCYLCDRPAVVEACVKCGKPYCLLDTSKFDLRYCNECMIDITIEEKTYTRTTQEYDETTDTFHKDTRSSEQILFSGIDWMFAQHRLSQMSDVEAKIEFQYHKAMVTYLEDDLLTRSVKNYKLKVQSDLSNKQAKIAARIERQTEVRTRKVVKSNAPFDPVAFAKQLLAMGITNLNIDNGKKQ